jgi:hypothetical protein
MPQHCALYDATMPWRITVSRSMSHAIAYEPVTRPWNRLSRVLALSALVCQNADRLRLQARVTPTAGVE